MTRVFIQLFIGTLALLVSFIRIVLNHFTNKHHFGFESAIWYWHFVDVVWLFLFINGASVLQIYGLINVF